jgi:hypothetical protein
MPRRSATVAPTPPAPAAQRVESDVVVLEATRVERLAYTRSQAATALGISRSTFIRHVLPYVETIEMGSGSRLIPVDELERYAADGRRPARTALADRTQPGRPAVLSNEVVTEIRARRDAGESLAQIARELNAAGTPTAHGGARWWPSTVRAVLERVPPRQQKRT